MHRIKIYMVTYRNSECVKNNLDSLWASLADDVPNIDARIEVNIINNHSAFGLPDEYKEHVLVHHNLRLDESCGHLSRDWNYALIDGFRDLNNPRCEQVICVHDDVIWHKDWLSKILDIHKTYDFYIGNYGCSFHSYLPSAVKKIGLWDERFCNIGYHEADYMLRARIYNPNGSSINDNLPDRMWNPTSVFFDHPPQNPDKNVAANESQKYHPVSLIVFDRKWGVCPERWTEYGVDKNPPKVSKIPNFVYYPYFEKDVEDLEGKNYIVAWDNSWEKDVSWRRV